jgi:hypothetical protein
MASPSKLERMDLRRLSQPGRFSDATVTPRDLADTKTISASAILLSPKPRPRYNVKQPATDTAHCVRRLASNDTSSICRSASSRTLQFSTRIKKSRNDQIAEQLAAAYEMEEKMKTEVQASARVVRMTESVLKSCDRGVVKTKERIVHNLEEANHKLQALINEK